MTEPTVVQGGTSVVGDWKVSMLGIMENISTGGKAYHPSHMIHPPEVRGQATFGVMQPDSTGSVSFQHTYAGETTSLTGTYHLGKDSSKGLPLTPYQVVWDNDSTLWSGLLWSENSISLGIDVTVRNLTHKPIFYFIAE